MATLRDLVETPHLAVRDLACRSPRSGQGAARGGESTHLVLVRRGAFTVHVGRRAHVADVCTALVSWADTDYRISHPGDRGDDCIVIELSPALADEALAALRPRHDLELRLPPHLQLAVAAFTAAVRHPACDALAREEATLRLMQRLLAATPAAPTGRPAQRRIARRAVEVLHRDLARSPSIASIADELGCSPFHLMHVMRAELGLTIRGYRVAARLGAALHRLADGERDLAALAHELGFASHAHLTDTCVRLVGVPPRELRRSFLEARLPPPP